MVRIHLNYMQFPSIGGVAFFAKAKNDGVVLRNEKKTKSHFKNGTYYCEI